MAHVVLDTATAEAIVEQLRYGIPPAGHILEFTVGRNEQLTELRRSLKRATAEGGSALLVRANYGAGKSHLLKMVRELALQAGYAVSLVEVNAQEGVRFNRMDTILGAVAREIEVPGSDGRGIAELFDRFAQSAPGSLSDAAKQLRSKISRAGKWDYSDFLHSPAIYVAIRAWVHGQGDGDSRQLLADWLSNPQNYRGQRRLLYAALIQRFRAKFRDTRAEWQFYAEDVFMFHTAGHRQSWDALADLDTVARASGLKGLILLFDEFEDVIQNLNRRDFQEAAFLNLFRFFSGERFPGMAYFAVTPDFVRKCREELTRRGAYGFDYQRFDTLAYFELDQIDLNAFIELAKRIRQAHTTAYNWNGTELLGDSDLRDLARSLWAVQSPDRVRRATKGVVDELDRLLQRTEAVALP